jgi:phosphohistidine phosphatase
MLTLILLRHAKAEPGRATMADRDRALAARGRGDAVRAGRWLKEAGLVPDLVVCSAARRTRETWTLAAETLGTDVTTTFEAAIYEATPARLLTTLRRTPAAVRCLLMIGHNPGLEELTADLMRDADPEAAKRLAQKFPTSGLAVLALPATDWAHLVPRNGHLAHFVGPRYFAG